MDATSSGGGPSGWAPEVSGPPLNFVTWGVAALPVVSLFALVVSGKVKTPQAAVIVAVVTAVLGATVFGAGFEVLSVALGKGLWLGVWILLVVWPALLLYRIAADAGIERIGTVLHRLLPRGSDRLLALAWVLPSFIQGVAGFGTPIAVAAPLLVALGYRVRPALMYTLIGYHWSVTFGSMGSSFYMASLTAGLSGSAQGEFALRAALLLGVNCLAAGGLVLLVEGGVARLREGLGSLLVIGLAMGLTLIGVAVVVPALASLAAGTAGFATLTVRGLANRRRSPAEAPPSSANGKAGGSGSLALISPYLYLLATALPVLGFPLTREWAESVIVVAPRFPRTVTAEGWVNAAVTEFTPLAIGAHPGTYLLLACLLGYLTYRRTGLLTAGRWRPVSAVWARGLPKSSAPILLLGVVAMMLTDTGMIQILAEGVAEVAGGLYPLLAAVLGAAGSFMTGSTTASNALLAGFQQEVAGLLGIERTILLAAQTAGGNVGNAVAPVVILVGLSAVGDADELSSTLRSTLPAMVVLAGLVTAGTWVMIALAGG